MSATAQPSLSSNLPMFRTQILGREVDIANVVSWLERPDIALVTLVGPGGVGKTRLAVEVAHAVSNSYADGVWFIDLSLIMDAALVVPTIAQTMGIHMSSAQHAGEALEAALRQHHALLLIDNVEHVVVAAPDIAGILQSCPLVKILATSRIPLHIHDEREYPVTPLYLPDPASSPSMNEIRESSSCRLFVQRAQTVKPDFALTDHNASVLLEICHHLDGLPLAIELAAARLKALSPATLREQLANRMTFLVGGPRDAPLRQRTMVDTIAWSYNLLPSDDEWLFRQLSVFSGDWTLEACRHVVTAGPGLVDGITALVDHSLVQHVEQLDGSARYHMLETLREYAEQQLKQAGEWEARKQAHALYYLTFAEQRGREVFWGDEATAIALLNNEYGNIQAALSFVIMSDDPDPELVDAAMRAVGFLLTFWRMRGMSEGRFLADMILSKRGSSDEARALGLAAGGAMAADQGAYVQACLYHEEAYSIAQKIDDVFLQSVALWGIGRAALWSGDIARAIEANQTGIALLRERGKREWSTGMLDNLGAALTIAGDLDHAQHVLDEAWDAACKQHIDAPESNAPDVNIMINRGLLWLLRGELRQAHQITSEALLVHREHGPSKPIAQCLELLGWIAGANNQPDRAARLLGAAEALRELIRTPLPPVYHKTAEHFTARARSGVRNDAWDRAYQSGRGLSFDAAAELALRPRLVATNAELQEPIVKLSCREVEVLQLISRGLTDAQVADQLFIARRTVNTHLTSIYTKLGVSSRAAATRLAIEHGLS